MAKDLLSSNENETNKEECVPRFVCPLYTEIEVPGTYLYVHITRPGPPFPRVEAKKLHNHGVEIVSGKFYDEPDYCRINFCDKGFVKTIVVLTKKVCVLLINLFFFLIYVNFFDTFCSIFFLKSKVKIIQIPVQRSEKTEKFHGTTSHFTE